MEYRENTQQDSYPSLQKGSLPELVCSGVLQEYLQCYFKVTPTFSSSCGNEPSIASQGNLSVYLLYCHKMLKFVIP